MIEYPVKVELHIDNEEMVFLIDPQDLDKIASVQMKKRVCIDPDMEEEKKGMVRAARVLVKGGLIAFGPKILDLLFKSKNHPKPEKGDDIVEWYANMFAKVFIAEATQGTLVLHASRGEPGAPIIIDEIRPIPMAERVDGGEGRGTGDSQTDASRDGFTGGDRAQAL